MKTTKIVHDGPRVKLTAEQRGMLEVKFDEIIRRIEEGTLSHPRVMLQLQMVIEGKVDTSHVYEKIFPSALSVEVTNAENITKSPMAREIQSLHRSPDAWRI